MPVEIPENFICDTLLLLLEEFKKKRRKYVKLKDALDIAK